MSYVSCYRNQYGLTIYANQTAQSQKQVQKYWRCHVSAADRYKRCGNIIIHVRSDSKRKNIHILWYELYIMFCSWWKKAYIKHHHHHSRSHQCIYIPFFPYKISWLPYRNRTALLAELPVCHVALILSYIYSGISLAWTLGDQLKVSH